MKKFWPGGGVPCFSWIHQSFFLFSCCYLYPCYKKHLQVSVCPRFNFLRIILNINFSQVQDYVRRSCDALCHRLAANIISCYEDNLHLKEDPVYDDVVQHRAFALEKNSLFVGRKELLSRIVSKVSDFSAKKPIVVHGQSGKNYSEMWFGIK